MVAQGHTLLEASVVDQTSIISLPIDAFEGQPLSGVIQDLESEWKRILDAPVGRLAESLSHTRMEHCLVYFSQAVRSFKPEDLARILQQSRHNNALSAVTGVLLYRRGRIIQVLEGDKRTLQALYTRIEHDPRHTAVRLVLNRPIQTRLFSRWQMGYETLKEGQLEEIQRLIDLESGNEREGGQTEEPILLKTINVFYQSNHSN